MDGIELGIHKSNHAQGAEMAQWGKEQPPQQMMLHN